MREVMTNQCELAFYGDDFTGSTDVLESLSLKGKKTVLWLKIPTEQQRAAFPNYDCIGLAGVSRSKSPAWMMDHLPDIFQFLHSFLPRYVHYKVCSTFDSSQEKGNLGTALKIGQEIIKPNWTSIVVGTPKLKRYVLFGELFADYKGVTYRIDRHPVMSLHPATPMNEASLVKHLDDLGVEQCQLIPFTSYDKEMIATKAVEECIQQGKVALFDSFSESTLAKVGDLVRQYSQSGIHLSVSSSGFEDAIYADLPDNPKVNISARTKILALSGSCSPVTQSQIEHAIQNGFVSIKLDMTKLVEPSLRAPYLAEIADQCIRLLAQEQSPIVYSALGPNEESLAFVKHNGPKAFDQILGSFLGGLAVTVTQAVTLERLAIAGGDTSGYCIQSLNIDALTYVASLCAGVPLCRAHSEDPATDGLELALKGGQMGDDDFFAQLRSGRG